MLISSSVLISFYKFSIRFMFGFWACHSRSELIYKAFRSFFFTFGMHNNLIHFKSLREFYSWTYQDIKYTPISFHFHKHAHDVSRWWNADFRISSNVLHSVFLYIADWSFYMWIGRYMYVWLTGPNRINLNFFSLVCLTY